MKNNTNVIIFGYKRKKKNLTKNYIHQYLIPDTWYPQQMEAFSSLKERFIFLSPSMDTNL